MKLLLNILFCTVLSLNLLQISNCSTSEEDLDDEAEYRSSEVDSPSKNQVKPTMVKKLPPGVSIPGPLAVMLSAPAGGGKEAALAALDAFEKGETPPESSNPSSQELSEVSEEATEPEQPRSLPMMLISKLPPALRLLFPSFGFGWIKKTVTHMRAGIIWDGTSSSDRPPQTPNVKPPNTSKTPFYMTVAGAAYCKLEDLKEWTCPLCNNEGSYDFVNGTILQSRSKIYILQNEDEEEFVVAVRGAENTRTILPRTFRKFISPSVGPANILVHRGFNAEAKKLMPFIKQNLIPLTKSFPHHKIIFTGHGFGGAIAELLYFYSIEQKIFRKKKFEIFTYGSPRVGNKQWADYMNSQRIPIARVVNGMDLMAHVPFAGIPYASSLSMALGNVETDYFYHHGTEVWILPNTQIPITCSNDFYEDPKCSASVAPLYNDNDHLKYFDVDILACADPFEEIVKSASPIDLPVPRMTDIQHSMKQLPIFGDMYKSMNSFWGLGKGWSHGTKTSLINLPGLLDETNAFKELFGALRELPSNYWRMMQYPSQAQQKSQSSEER